MKKYISVIITMLLTLAGCIGKERMGFSERDRLNLQMADKIVECMNQEDVDGLYNLFSENLKTSDITLETNIKKLYKYINGKVESYEKFGIFSKSSIEKNRNSTYYDSQFKLLINGDTYLLYYSYTVKDDFYPETIGLNYVKIILEADDDKYFCYWNEIEPGIFLPDEAK